MQRIASLHSGQTYTWYLTAWGSAVKLLLLSKDKYEYHSHILGSMLNDHKTNVIHRKLFQNRMIAINGSKLPCKSARTLAREKELLETATFTSFPPHQKRTSQGDIPLSINDNRRQARCGVLGHSVDTEVLNLLNIHHLLLHD